MKFLYYAAIVALASSAVASAQWTEDYLIEEVDVDDFDIAAGAGEEFGQYGQQQQLLGQYGQQQALLGQQAGWTGAAELGQFGQYGQYQQQQQPLLAGQQQFAGAELQQQEQFGTGFQQQLLGSGFQQQPLLSGASTAWSGKGYTQPLIQPTKQQPIQLAAQTLPTVRMQLPDQYQGMTRSNANAMYRSKGVVRASPIYNPSVVNTQVIERNLIQPILKEQTIRRKHFIDQPIISNRLIEQPVVTPYVTQRILRTRVVPQPILQQRTIVQPMIQPRVIEQTNIVQKPLTEAHENAPLRETINVPAQQPIVQRMMMETAKPIVNPEIHEQQQPVMTSKKGGAQQLQFGQQQQQLQF